jgi:hypothetical protein
MTHCCCADHAYAGLSRNGNRRPLLVGQVRHFTVAGPLGPLERHRQRQASGRSRGGVLGIRACDALW